MRARGIKVEPYKGFVNEEITNLRLEEKRQRKPYNARFKDIIAGLPSRTNGHRQMGFDNLQRRAKRNRRSLVEDKCIGLSSVNLLVSKSLELLEQETQKVGNLNPDYLEAIALEEDPTVQIDIVKALPTSIIGKKIVSGKHDRFDDECLQTFEARRKARRLLGFTGRANWAKYTARSRLSANPAKVLSGFDGWRYKRKLEWRKFRIQTKEATTFLELWGSSFKRIEGMFGNGVSSYFRFLKWLFLLNVAIFLLMFVFVVIPHVVFASEDPATVTMVTAFPTGSPNVTSVTQQTTNNDGVNMSAILLHEQCSEKYVVQHDDTFPQVLLDFIQGTGWMEKTMLFYGMYRPKSLTIGTFGEKQYNYNMPLAYLLVTFFYMGLSLYLMLSQTNATFREQLKDSFTANQERKGYANIGLAGWDFSLSSVESATVRHTNLFNEIRGYLEEDRILARRKARTTYQFFRIVVIRILLNIFVLITLAGAAYLIYFATIKSTELKENTEYETSPKLAQLAIEFIPSLTITVLNFLIPLVFSQVARGEDYHPDFEVRITLGRTVFLRLASLAMLLATIYGQVLCSPRDQCRVGVPPHCFQLRCWETYVGQNLYKLMILNFVVNVVVVFLVETPKRIIGSKCNVKVFKLLGQKSEFVIPKNVLDLVYAQTICWLGSFFAPLLPAMSMASFFILFYLKKLTVIYNYRPAKRPYRSSRSQVFFMLVLLAAYLLCCVPICYCIWKISPSYGCGPFRNYTHMYSVVTKAISTWPQILQDVLSLLTSTTSAIILIVVLGLLVYYYRGASKGHQEAVLLLNEQMMHESKDRQFLLARLNEVTGSQQQGTSNASVRPNDKTSINMPNSIEQTRASPSSSDGQKSYNTFGDSAAPLANPESISND